MGVLVCDLWYTHGSQGEREWKKSLEEVAWMWPSTLMVSYPVLSQYPFNKTSGRAFFKKAKSCAIVFSHIGC